MTAFPLLCTPLLISREIVRQLLPVEQVILSLCSKRARRLVKIHVITPENWKLLLVTNKQRRTAFESDKDHFDLLGIVPTSDNSNVKGTIRINGYTVPISWKMEYLVTHWDDINLGIRVVTEYCTDLYNTVVYILNVSKRREWVVDWIHERQKILYEVCHDGKFNEELLTRQLSHLNVDTMFYSFMKIPDTFRYSGKFPNPIRIGFDSGGWVTLENLLSMSSKHIEIGKSKFSEEDINRYLKIWMNGECSRLQYLAINMESVSLRKVIDGIQGATLINEERTFTWERDSDLYSPIPPVQISHGYNIVNVNGVMATVIEGWFLGPSICVCVWPDAHNNVF
uniref:FBA_2 domain-containing protein n=1 Tax=Caenorhabditis tropicalis TaxID=1561998 RepID=A0A1I7UZC5_9PELO